MKRLIFLTMFLIQLSVTGQSTIKIPFKLQDHSKMMIVNVNINGKIDHEFIVDTGSSTITINEDLFAILLKSGEFPLEDILSTAKVSLADGSIIFGKIIRIKTLNIGGFVLSDVEVIVLPGSDASCLIGQDIFNQFGKFTIDFNRNQILLELKDGYFNDLFIRELKLIPCSIDKIDEVKFLMAELSKNINDSTLKVKISCETNIPPPKKAVDNINSQYTIRYFSNSSLGEAERINLILYRLVGKRAHLENMLPFYNLKEIPGYVEIWLK